MSTSTVTELGPRRPRIETILITPKAAGHWLKTCNTHNRTLRPRAVTDYARDMATGNWAMNGESIKFAADGTLLDGQHRLAAVVEAGVSVFMLVVFDLDPSTQETMDAGRRRNAGDVLSLRGEQYTHILASVLRMVWQWERGDARFTGRQAPTTAELTALLGTYPEVRRSAEIASQIYTQFRYIPQSAVGTAHFVFSRISTADAVWFFARVADGAGLDVGHPVLTLRNRVISDRGANRRVNATLHMAYMVRAWNAYRAGRSLDRIVHAPGAQMPEPQ